jgi:hypothetical protein
MFLRYFLHPKQRTRDLPQRAHPYRAHQYREGVAIIDYRALQALQHDRCPVRVTLVEVLQALQLALLLFLGGVRQLDALGHRITVRVAEGVHADNRELAQ